MLITRRAPSRSRLGSTLLPALLAALMVAGCAAPSGSGTPSGGAAPPRPAAGPSPAPGRIPSTSSAAPPPAEPMDPAVAQEAARQSVLALRQELLEQARLHAVFWPINRASAPLCATRELASIGATPRTLATVRETSRPLLRAVLGIDERLTFSEVVDDTPAARAGIQPGDRILAIDDTDVPATAEAPRTYLQALQRGLSRQRPVALRLLRRGAELTVSVQPEAVCAAGASPLAGDNVTAHARGRSVLVTRGMLRFASDRELAIVIAHEIAHIALGHTQPPSATPPAALAPAPGGEVAQALAASPPPPTPTVDPAAQRRAQVRELDADIVGVHLAAAAGWPISEAPAFWRRMAINNPSTIVGSHTRTHPASSERFVVLERVVKDLAERQAAGRPLAATLRDGSATATPTRIVPGGASGVRWMGGEWVPKAPPAP